jgi:hypothetical protein
MPTPPWKRGASAPRKAREKPPASAAVAQHAEPEHRPWSSYRSHALGEEGAAKLNQQRQIKTLNFAVQVDANN